MPNSSTWADLLQMDTDSAETIAGEPIPHTKYPFGFPLLLAITHILFPDNLIALKSLVVLLYAISIPLTYLLIRCFAAFAQGTRYKCTMSRFSPPVGLFAPGHVRNSFSAIFSHSAHPPPPRPQESNTLSTLAFAIIAISRCLLHPQRGHHPHRHRHHLFCPAQKMERNGAHRHRQPYPRPPLSNPQRITWRKRLHQTTPQHKPLPPGRGHAHIHRPDRTHPRKSRTLRPANHPPHLSTQFYRHQLLCRYRLLRPGPLRR